MTLQADLLRQAQRLALVDPRRPQQANLRRAVSASYYALFHLLTDEAARRLVRSPDRTAHRNLMRRAFDHNAMRAACRAFGQRQPPSWLASTGIMISADLMLVAAAFDFLQEERHDADYNHASPFTRVRALEASRRVEEAFAAWSRIRGQPDADMLLIALLIKVR